MQPHNHAQDEIEITGDLPAEPCAVLTFPQDRNSTQPPLAEAAGTGDFLYEDEEPTIVEGLKRIPPKSPLYQFIFSPHYKTAFSVGLHRYLRGVRSRMVKFRETNRAQHPDSGFEKIRQWIERAVRHAKRNLAVK